MKTKSIKILFTCTSLFSIALLNIQADPIVWDSTKVGGDWTNSSNWIGGSAPTGSDDVLIEGPLVGQSANATIGKMGDFNDLNISFLDPSTAKTVYLEFDTTTEHYGNSLDMQSNAAGTVVVKLNSGSSLVIEKDIVIGTGGDEGTTGVTLISMSSGANLEFDNLWLDAKSVSGARLQFVSSAGKKNTVKGDIYVGSGGQITYGATSYGEQEIQGNVYLGGGSMTVGRADATTDKFTITGLLEITSGTASVYEKNTLNVDSLSLTGGTFRLANDNQVQAGPARLVVENNLLIGGNSSFSVGGSSVKGYIEVRGDMIVQDTPYFTLAGDTDFVLKGDWVVSATSLRGSSDALTGMKLVLSNERLQNLEAAASSTTKELGIGKLTLSDSTMQLVNEYAQGADDYFWTITLENSGESTIYLNGLSFYYGADGSEVLLAPGVYTEFGGTLNVLAAIPEPLVSSLILLGVLGAMVMRFRKRSSV